MADRASASGRDSAPERRATARSGLRFLDQMFGRVSGGARYAPPSDSPALWLARDHVQDATRGARRLLGSAAAPGAPLEGLLRALTREDAHLERSVNRLLSHGEPFRRRARLHDSRIYEVEGAPVGAICVLMLRDVHDEATALERTQAALRRAEAEAELLRAALDAVPAPVWRESAEGATLWRNAAAEALESANPAARAAGAEEMRRVPGSDEAGSALIAAPSIATAEASGAMRRFVETVTETFANLRVGLAIYDSDRKLILSNPAMAEIFGADPDWLAGGPSLRETLDRLRETRRLPEQADYPAWRATLFTLFDDVRRARYEDVWELPDGRGIHVVARPHPLGGIVFMFEDFTESMALQRWRSTAVEVRRATLDMLGEGVVVFGPDGQTRIANPACRAIWGLPAEEGAKAGSGLPAHVAEFAVACGQAVGGAEALWTRIRAAVSGGGGRAAWSGRVDLSDGRILEARVAPMPDGSTLAAFTDVTASERVAAALRERAAALEASAAMRDALVDQLSHRLRTPLNAVFGFAQMLRGGRAGPLSEQQAEYVENIENAARLMLDGVEHLSDLISTESAASGDAPDRPGEPPSAAPDALPDALPREAADGRL